MGARMADTAAKLRRLAVELKRQARRNWKMLRFVWLRPLVRAMGEACDCRCVPESEERHDGWPDKDS